jgi:hypothetical protein
MLRLEEIMPTHLHSHLPLLPHTMPTKAKSKESASQRTALLGQLCKLDTTHLRTDIRATDNSGFKKLAVQWLNEHLCFVSSVVVADSFVLRYRQLLKPANRYAHSNEDSL